MQRKFSFSEGEYYHIYNRGVEKRKIFLNKSDYERFLKLLYIANGEERVVFRDTKKMRLADIKRGAPLVAIGAYALMPNHFHILVREIKPEGISKFMEKLSTSYASYFNKRYNRVGSLFQGTFKAQHVTEDEYLKYLFSYIHLNPVKIIEPNWKEEGIKNKTAAERYLSNYKYSSYPEYLDSKRQGEGIISTKEFPEYFLKSSDFKSSVEEWLAFKDDFTHFT